MGVNDTAPGHEFQSSEDQGDWNRRTNEGIEWFKSRQRSPRCGYYVRQHVQQCPYEIQNGVRCKEELRPPVIPDETIQLSRIFRILAFRDRSTSE